jgi:hypothetical protein
VNTAITHHTIPSVAEPDDDPFHDPIVIGIGIAFVVVAIVTLVLMGLFIWGNLYGAPSWNSHAFPPAVVH